ncbi:ABC transporter ATP-binding protein [Serinibacter arcticus]|uniref:ABC transporter ATP-binding protein n=1 Tax=Serinibacter arcticus TaxID=1655435 RepID=UPI001304D212|nr:ABC transporter ATP-binding protein [Serinibacter arcticus]
MSAEAAGGVVETDALEVVLPGGDGVGPLTATLGPGEHVLVLGPSGSGKTTLLRTLAGAVPQHVRARVTGTVRIAGTDPVTAGVIGVCEHVGTVAQDPVSGVCLPLVADEVALPLENRAVPRDLIGPAVDAALATAGAAHLRERASGELSGGELQRVALAAATVTAPRLLLLDEPTSMLDAPGVAAVRDAVARVGDDVAVVLVEHRLDEWAAGGTAALPARTVALGRSGRVLADGPTARVLAEHGRELLRQGCWLPLDAELEALLGLGGGLGSPHVRGALLALTASEGPGDVGATAERGPVVLGARGLTIRAGGRPVLTGVDLDLHAGELVAVVGANGAGKSTLLAALAGLERPAAGTVDGPRPGLVFQDPEHQLVGATVREEIAFGLPHGSSRVADALARFDLADWAEHSPYALSGGQKRRLSLAAMLVHDRPVLLADEPGYGLDRAATAVAMGALREAADGGLAVALTSHDLRAVAACADSVVVLADGGVAAVLTPEELLRDPVALASAGMVVPPLLAFLVEHDVPVRPALRLLEELAHDVAVAA